MQYIKETRPIPKELIFTKEEFEFLKTLDRTLTEIWQNEDVRDANYQDYGRFVANILEEIEIECTELYTEDTFSIDLRNYL